MMAGILQTNYLPWPGVFEMMDRVDVFVYHNDIQYNLSWRNRNRIRVPSALGWVWLTVPVKLVDGSQTLINKTVISYDHPWNKKHWNLIYEHYHNAPYFKKFADPYKEILLGKKWELWFP